MPLPSPKFADSSCRLRCGGSIRIETVRLDRAARAYEAHLRTQRYLRAGLGQMPWALLGGLAALLVTQLSEEPETSLLIDKLIIVAVMIGSVGFYFGLFLVMIY